MNPSHGLKIMRRIPITINKNKTGGSDEIESYASSFGAEQEDD